MRVERKDEWESGGDDGFVWRGEEFGLVGAARAAFFHLLDFVDKLTGFLELAIDGGVADVGDGVDGLEFLHGTESDEPAGYFATALGA